MKDLEIQAIELLSLGKTEAEVAQACGKSRSWVQRVKRKFEAEKLNCVAKLHLLPDISTTKTNVTKDIQLDKKDIQPAKREKQPTLPQTVTSRHILDLDQLYEDAINQVRSILNDPEGRKRDILAAAKLVIETRQKSFMWSSEMKDFNNLCDRDIVKRAMRNILAGARTQAEIISAMKGLIEADRIQAPPQREVSTTEKIDKQEIIDYYKNEYGVDLSENQEFKKYFKFYTPNDTDFFLDQIIGRQYID